MPATYQLATTCTFRMLPSGAVEALPDAHDRRMLSRAQWQLACEFAEPHTAREIYEQADAELSMEEFSALLDVLAAAGVLDVVRDRSELDVGGPDIGSVLCQDVFGSIRRMKGERVPASR